MLEEEANEEVAIGNDEEDSSESHSSDDASDSDEGGEHAAEDLLSLILPRDDPHRMRLTEEEWHRALDIRAAIEATPDLDNISDFMCAQYSICCGTDNTMAHILERITTLQAFREEYGVLDTYEDGCLYLKEIHALAPGKDLDFSFSECEGTYVFCHDTTKLDSTQFTTLKKLRAFMAYTYYMSASWNPDMDSIRKGIICISDCEAWDWRKKQDFKVFQKFFKEFLAVYPFNGECRCYNTGLIANIMISLLRRVLPDEIRDTLKTGYKTDQALHTYYFIPNRESANHRMFTKMAATLKKRFENEKSFNLMSSSLYYVGNR